MKIRQTVCCVFAVCVIAMRVNRPESAKNRLVYCVTCTCMCAKAVSCLCSVYRVRKDVAVTLCMCELQREGGRVVIASPFDCV